MLCPYLAALSGFCSPLILHFASTAEAKDSDRDGLSDKREKRLKTNPRKADTDSDLLRDGREVKQTRTNPRKADTDGDGLRDGREVRDGLSPRDPDSDDGTRDLYERKGVIQAINYTADNPQLTVQTKRGTIFQVQIDERTFLEGLDRDGDLLLTLSNFQIGDRVEVNLDPGNPARAQTLELHVDDEGNEWKGSITEIVASEVTVRNRGGVTRTFTVDIDTFLRAPDRNADGVLSINDLMLGDRVEVHLSGDKALSLEVEYGDDYDGHDGYEDSEGDEVEGILLPGFTESELRIAKRGRERVILINASTQFFGDDRNLDGRSDVADLLAGDKIEAVLESSSGGVALAIEYESEGDGCHGSEESEIKGFILSTDPLVIEGMRGEIVLVPGSETEYDVSDRNSDSQEDFADFQVGDFVEAKFRVSDNLLLEMELKRAPDQPDDD